MARLSSYTILSERLSGGGYALMSGLTGAIDLISEEVAIILMRDCSFKGNQGKSRSFSDTDVSAEENRLGNDGSPAIQSLENRVISIPDELSKYLLERGHFTDLSHEEERAYIAELAEALHSLDQNRPAFVIIPTFECNYRCTYCFERPLQNSLDKLGNANNPNNNISITAAQIEQIYKSIEQIKLKTGDKTKGGLIVLFGGEPLNADNRDSVFAIIRRGMAEGFGFAAISNGHDLEQFIPLIEDGGISQVQITVDGPKKIHDKRRICKKGGSSFDKIIDNIHKVLVQKRLLVQIRVNIDTSNIEFFDSLLDEFSAFGLLNNKSVIIYVNTVYSKDSKGNVTPRISNSTLLRQLRSRVSKFKNVFVTAAAINSRMNILPSLMKGTPYPLHSTFCAANSGNYIFAPDGNIYTCWESVGLPNSRIGSYMTKQGLVFDKESVDKWYSRCTALIPECLDCAFCLVCGGGCAQFAEYNNGTLYKNYCDDFEQTFRVALADNVEEFLIRYDRHERGLEEVTGFLEQYYG
jgi:uncharacterized protein